MSSQHAPTPPSAAEALSSLLWQPYECRSPLVHFARSRTEGALSTRGGPLALQLQSPDDRRHARAQLRAHSVHYPDMRLPVPALPARPEPVSVSVPSNVSSVRIVSTESVVNSAVQTERERSVVSAECQTEDPGRRRRARRVRAGRLATLAGEVPDPSLPPPPYSTLPPPPALLAGPPPPVLLAGPPPPVIPPPPPPHRFPFQPIPLRYVELNLKCAKYTSL